MNFEFDGEKYRLASAHQKEWGSKLVAELALNGAERILDLGCGDGDLTAELAKRVPDGFVLGIDSSPSMIAAAGRWKRPNLSFELGDISQVEHREKFDVLFSNSALHWIKDHSRLFPRLLGALRTGGIMRFNFPAAGNSATFNGVIAEVMSLPRYAPGFRGFEWPWFMPAPDEYRSVLARFPCQGLRVYGEPADRFFPDLETVVRWLDQPCLVPFLPWVAPEDREAFRVEVIDRMNKAARQADGRFFEAFRRVHVFCRK